MDIPIQITFKGLEHSDALEAEIRARAAKLGQRHHHLTSCRVVVEQPARHRHQGREFTVRLDVRAPGGEVAINRDHHEDVHVAVHEAFDAAARRLSELVERRAHGLHSR